MKKRRPKNFIKTTILFLIAMIFAVSFLLPTILTFANSFMTEQEISSNYGVIFNDYSSSSNGEKKTTSYRSETVNLKLIPDKVVGTQYETVLLKSPDYLMKFWNSVLLTLPIMIFQILIALGAAYCFARFRGRLREMIFFLYLVLMLMPYQVTLVPNYLVNKLVTSWIPDGRSYFREYSLLSAYIFLQSICEESLNRLSRLRSWTVQVNGRYSGR